MIPPYVQGSMDKGALAGSRILVVEDEPMIALDLEQLLRSAGAVVRTASGVQEALDLIGTEAFSAAVVDHGLRNEKSRAIYDELDSHSVPFVVYTGYDEVTGRPTQALIRKPAEPAKLIDALRSLLTP